MAKAEAKGCKDMDWFKCLMRLAQRTSSFSESHDFLYEHRCFSAFRFCMLKIGERLAKVGTFNDGRGHLLLHPGRAADYDRHARELRFRFIARDRRNEWVANKEYLSRPPIMPRDPNMTAS